MSEIRPEVINFMKERQWDLESDSDKVMTFRARGFVGKLSKMYEDRLTLTKSEEGYQLEGLRKDVMRLATGLEHRLNSQE